MKKIISTSICLSLTAIQLCAQIERTQVLKPVNNQIIKKIEEPAPLPANLTPGKDLTISIKNFQFDPANGSNVNISYVVKNNGTEPLDVNNVTVQGLIDGPQDIPSATPPDVPVNGKNYYGGGGHALATNTTILNPGQEKEGVLRCFNLSRNNYFNNTNNYSYLLMIDKGNKITEANETNNIAVYSFRGYQGQYYPSVAASQYYLTDAFVTIKTGADNKEIESEVNFRLAPGSSKNLAADNYNECVRKVAKNEMPFFSNSFRTLPLFLFMSSTATIANPPTSLASFQQNGLGLLIEYKPNLVLDAWKIEQVELVLCFKDANGAYHPTEGRKKITFNMPANTFLDGFYKHFLAIKANQSLSPVSVRVIEKLSDF